MSGKIRESINNMLKDNIGSFIMIPGFCFILYIWFTQGKPIFEFCRQYGLFTTVLPVVFFIVSCIFGISGYRERKYSRQVKYILCSFICCGVATWIFILDIDCKIRNQDISSLRDLAAYYSCASLFMWMIILWINVHTYRKVKKNIEKNI